MEPKALPPAKISPAKLLKGSSVLSTVKKISAKSTKGDGSSLELGIVKTQVIQVSDLIKTNTLLKAKEEERKKKEKEKKRFAEKEEKLEKPKEEKENKLKLPSVSRLGFLDAIKKFLFNIFLGYISLRLLPHLPKLTGIVDTIIKVQDVVIDVSGKILNGLVSFVDKAYEVHDKTRKFLGNLGGENFTKAFDGFIDVMDKAITASIVAAIAFGELGGDIFRDKKGGTPLKSGKELYKEYDPKRALIRKKYGDSFAQLYDLERAKGINSEQARKNVLSRYVGKGKITPQRMIGLGQIEGSNLLDRGLGRVPGRLATRVLGRSGKKAILGTVKPLLKRLPIIGALIDFGLSVALGEDPGRAAFKSIGAALFGSIGAAIGSLAFGFGGIIGGILGSVGGDAIGGALYDMFFSNKQTAKPKIQGRAQGGQVTRGGRYTGPVKRTIPKPKRTLKVQTTEIKPGQSVGGKDKIEKVFPEVEPENKGKIVNPLGYMKNNYKTASAIPGLGGLAALFMKAQLGQRPSNIDYQIAADGLSSWMQRATAGGVQRTVGAFAEGGEVDMGMFANSDDMKNVIAKSLQDSVAPKIDDMINDLMKQIDLKPTIEKDIQKEQQIQPGGEMVPGSVPRGQLTIEQLVGLAKGAGFRDNDAVLMAAVAMAESSGNSLSKREDTDVHGLWQIRYPVHIDKLKKLGVTSRDQLYDPVTNAKAAKAVFDSQGITAWSAFTNNAYKRFFAQAQAAKNTPSLATSPIMSGGSAGGKIAGELGRFIDSKGLGIFGSGVHRHPEHPPYSLTSGHSKGSLHYQGRAVDIGGNPQDQPAILKAIAEFNKLKGVKPVQLYHAGNDPKGHGDHVHVAYEKGGKVHGFTRAILGEKGPEFVIDADSTRALEENYPGFLNALNKANYEGAIQVLKTYASYEQGAMIHAIVDERLIPVPIPMRSSRSSSMSVSGFNQSEDYMASSYRG